MRIAAVGDIHCRVNSTNLIDTILPGIREKADVLALSGDLTDTGLPEEARVLCKQLQMLEMPVLAVLGNHDHENSRADEIKQLLLDHGIIVLDGSVHEVGDVGFIGTKGFCGGFGKNLVQPFGELALKKFIQAGIKEVIQLENALAKLECQYKMAILHYSPIIDTLQGEPPELFAFLGSSRLADALDRTGVDVIIHSHAHHGSPEGKTPGQIPVYNVSRFVQFSATGKCYMLITLGKNG